MPRISKIRIAGLQYENLKKNHKDTIFDLTTENGTGHTLFTLQNGCGKGVMLQAIAQVLIPGVKWGKNDGNQVEGFFSQDGKMVPYTFHILIEWLLDNEEKTYIWTGICMSIDTKVSDEEDEENKLKYFTYIGEKEKTLIHSFESIPLYNKEQEQGTDYENFKKFIKDNSKYFISFSKNHCSGSNSKYQQSLKTYNIYNEEWKTIKEINRFEGGVEAYFKDADNNKKLFENKIIPIVSQNLDNQFPSETHALSDIFISSVKIARNLPLLLDRYEDNLRVENELLSINALIEKGKSRNKRYNSLKLKGNNIALTFHKGKENVEKEIEKWNKEIVKTEEENNLQQYNLACIKYTSILNANGKISESLQEGEQLDIKLKEAKTKLNNELKNLQVNEKVIDLNALIKDKKIKENELEGLQKTLDISDLEKQLNDLKQELKDTYEKEKHKIEQVPKEYYGYKQYLSEEEQSKEVKKEKLEKEKEIINKEINKFEIRQEKLEEDRQQLISYYDAMRINMLDVLLQVETDNYNRFDTELQKKKKKKQSNEKKINKTQINMKKLEIDSKNIDKETKNILKEFDSKKQEEIIFIQEINNILNLEDTEKDYSKKWLGNISIDIETNLKDKKQKQIKAREEIWYNQLDLSINNKDYWIPNKDIIDLKERIEAMDIKVQLGMEYIKSKGEQGRELLKQKPYLPFCIVVRKKEEVEQIKKYLSINKIQHAPSIIYCINESDEYNLVSLEGKEQKFIEEDYFINWKEKLEQTINDYEEFLYDLEKKEEILNDLFHRCKKLINEETSKEINNRLNEKEEKKKQIDHQLMVEKQILQDLESKLEELTNSIESLSKELSDSYKRKDKVSVLYEEEKKLKRREKEIKKLKNQKSSIEENFRKLQSEIDEIKSINIQQDRDYDEWLKNIVKFYNELKGFIGNIEFVVNKDSIETVDGPRFYDVQLSELSHILKQCTEIGKSYEEKNFKIKYIKENVEETQNKIIEKQDEIKLINEEWMKIQVSYETKKQVFNKIKQTEDEKNKTEEKIQQLSEQLGAYRNELKILSNQIKNEKNRISDKFKRVANVFEGNLETQKYESEKLIAGNNKYIQECNRIINKENTGITELKFIIHDMNNYGFIKENEGVVDKILLQNQKYKEVFEKWRNEEREIKKALEEQRRETEEALKDLKDNIKKNVKDETLKIKLLEILNDFIIENYEENSITINSIIENCKFERSAHEDEKKEAEKARITWVERATRQVITISGAIKEMINKMKIENQKNEKFPLVKLSKDQIMPKDENKEVIGRRLSDYFIECIQNLQANDMNIEDIPKKELNKMMNNSRIFREALTEGYPIIQVYKMTEQKEFMYQSPQSRHYVSWQAIQKGEGYNPEGSGGQTLSINTLMMMMLLSYKKKPIHGQSPYTTLIMDNPFGKASDDHVLDPIFIIADKLNFQIIAFAAPKIIKPEISERFPIFWSLEIANKVSDNMLGTVTGTVKHGGRIVKV